MGRWEDKLFFVAGHRGMVGSALVRALNRSGCTNLIVAAKSELDLRDQRATLEFLRSRRPEVILISAARVGGIHANRSYPAEFLYDNLMIAANLVRAAHECEVERLLFLGSSCIYPKFADQPIREGALLTGALEPTNEAYALAKIAGLKLCEYFRREYGRLYHSAMPSNVYGIGDNFHPENSHVIPALIRRFHNAKIEGRSTVSIWGTGSAKREFLYADDLGEACMHLLRLEDPPSLVNVGSGQEVSIYELSRMVAETVGWHGEILTDPSMPDGTPRKLLDSSLIETLGWKPRVVLGEGLRLAYDDFLERNTGS